MATEHERSLRAASSNTKSQRRAELTRGPAARLLTQLASAPPLALAAYCLTSSHTHFRWHLFAASSFACSPALLFSCLVFECACSSSSAWSLDAAACKAGWLVLTLRPFVCSLVADAESISRSSALPGSCSKQTRTHNHKAAPEQASMQAILTARLAETGGGGGGGGGAGAEGGGAAAAAAAAGAWADGSSESALQVSEYVVRVNLQLARAAAASRSARRGRAAAPPRLTHSLLF